jgi:amino acid transporter
MWPTSGGQYHWVAELSPKRYRPFLSCISGWISVSGWQALSASTAFAVASQIQVLVFAGNENYSSPRWQGTLIYWAVLWLAAFINVFLINLLPILEFGVAIAHIGLFIAFIAILCALGERNSSSFVWTEFVNSSGWSSDGVSWCIGLLSSSFVFIGKPASLNACLPIQWKSEPTQPRKVSRRIIPVN